MADASHELAILLSAQDATGPAMRSASANMGKLVGDSTGVGASFGKVATASIMAAGTLDRGARGMRDGFMGTIESAIGFEKQMSAVKAVSGATGTQMTDLSKLALQLGSDSVFTAGQVASGFEEMVKGGIPVESIMKGAGKSMIDLASAGGITLPEAATIAADSMNMFGIKAEGMAHAADMIAGAANASALDVNDFGQSLSMSGAVAKTIGFSFDDLSVAIGVMGAAGLRGSDAGTSLKTMMLNLSPSTKAAKGEMESLGLVSLNTEKAMEVLRKGGIDPTGMSAGTMTTSLAKLLVKYDETKGMTKEQVKEFNFLQKEMGLVSNAFFDANGKVKSMTDVAEILQSATHNLTEEQKVNSLQVMFGTDAIRAAAVMSKAGGDGFVQMAESMGKVTAASVGMERLNNTSGDIEQLKGSLDTLAITIGQVLIPVLVPLVKMGTEVIGGLLEGFKALPGPVQTFIVAFGGIVALGLPIALALGAVGVALGAITMPIVGAGLATVALVGGLAAMASSMKSTVPARAMGGPVGDGSPYWVGEQGPELFVPSQSGRIISAGQSRSMVANGGGGSSGGGGASGGGRLPIQLVLDRHVLAEALIDLTEHSARRGAFA